MRLLRPLIAALLLALALAAPASGDNALYSAIYSQYFQTGQINVCQYTLSDLQLAESEAPPDISTTAPTFAQALRTAIVEQPTTACTGGRPVASATSGSPTPTPTTGAGNSSNSVPLEALAVVLALVVLAGLWWVLAWWRGRPPHAIVAARHALAEAAYRAGGVFADFGDWLRLGR